MLDEKSLNDMQEAYGLVFKVEIMLREYIKKMMKNAYGPQWFQIAPRITLKRPPSKSFNSLHFHEYERIYFRVYSEAFQAIPEEFYRYLHVMYPIRNKIAHCHVLSELELSSLYSTYSFIDSFLLNQIDSEKPIF